jgi:hypothetical protein
MYLGCARSVKLCCRKTIGYFCAFFSPSRNPMAFTAVRPYPLKNPPVTIAWIFKHLWATELILAMDEFSGT